MRKKLCSYCKKEMTEIVRMLDDDKTPTYNTTWICENPECPLYIDYRKLKNWRRSSSVLFPEQPRRIYNK
ncbi:hypothetical protein J7L36_01845 [bacterium]|nr:hypothetical protein [bacterium]